MTGIDDSAYIERISCRCDPAFELIVPLIDSGRIILVLFRKVGSEEVVPKSLQDGMEFPPVIRLGTELEAPPELAMFDLGSLPDLVIDKNILNHLAVTMPRFIPLVGANDVVERRVNDAIGRHMGEIAQGPVEGNKKGLFFETGLAQIEEPAGHRFEEIPCMIEMHMVRPGGLPVSKEVQIGVVRSEGSEVNEMGMGEEKSQKFLIDPLIVLETFEGLFSDQ